MSKKFDLTDRFISEVRETGAGVHEQNVWGLIDELCAEVQRLRGSYRELIRQAVLCENAADFVSDMIEDAKRDGITLDGRSLCE